MMSFAVLAAAAITSCRITLAAAVVSVPVATPPTPPHMSHAKGTFEVRLAPMPADSHADGVSIGRMSIDKQFSGELEGASVGQMLTGMGGVKGSAGYVAVERVTGTLAGHRGSFMLLHRGVMDRGAQSLSITIVPDSGTDELAGITGSMTLIIDGKTHSYDLEYAIAPTH